MEVCLVVIDGGEVDVPIPDHIAIWTTKDRFQMANFGLLYAVYEAQDNVVWNIT